MMFRRVRTGWLRRAVTLLRWSRGIAYMSLGLAGLAAMIWPPTSIAAATTQRGSLVYVWAALMFLSATLCAYGVFFDRWLGEYIGLIPLSTVAAIFAVSALTRGPVSWAGGAFLFGMFWLLVSRWNEVALLKVEADRKSRERIPVPPAEIGIPEPEGRP